MNEEKIKSLLFAQYIGQKVFKYKACEWTDIVTPMQLIEVDGEILGQLLLRDVSRLEDSVFEAICRGIGLYHAKVVEHEAECIFVVDDSYSVGFYTDGTITMYKGHGLNIKPYWNNIKQLYQSMILFGVAMPFTYLNCNNQPETLSVDEQISRGWIKIHQP